MQLVDLSRRCARLEKHADADILRDMMALRAAADEAGGRDADRCGQDERSPERINQRNGYRERDWETRAGTVELRIPKAAQEPAPPKALWDSHFLS